MILTLHKNSRHETWQVFHTCGEKKLIRKSLHYLAGEKVTKKDVTCQNHASFHA
jgi:hypothetical protein